MAERVPNRRARARLAVSLALLVVLGLVVGGGWVAAREISGRFAAPADYSGTGTGSVSVRVSPGDTAADIARTLRRADVVRSVAAFTAAATADPRSRSIAPGTYRLRLRMSAQAALELLLDPSARQLVRVTIPEGYTLDQTLDRLSRTLGLSRAALDRLAKRPARLSPPAACHGQLEGCLFPATYDFEPGTGAVEALRAMLERFAATAEELQLAAGAKALGRSAYDVLVVASLVERETRVPNDYPKTARVIYNRLAKKMPLQLDSTVNYALGRNKTYVTLQDTRVASPYNTYRRTGLPPTPIASPGERALRAALSPDRGGWLYFVTVDAAGNNRYATTYAEFLRLKALGERNR